MNGKRKRTKKKTLELFSYKVAVALIPKNPLGNPREPSVARYRNFLTFGTLFKILTLFIIT